MGKGRLQFQMWLSRKGRCYNQIISSRKWAMILIKIGFLREAGSSWSGWRQRRPPQSGIVPYSATEASEMTHWPTCGCHSGSEVLHDSPSVSQVYRDGSCWQGPVPSEDPCSGMTASMGTLAFSSSGKAKKRTLIIVVRTRYDFP